MVVRRGHRGRLLARGDPKPAVVMRYLTLAADHGELSVRDEQAGPITVGDLGLPTELADRLIEWNRRYQVIIPKDMTARQAGETASLIDELDRIGLLLAERVAAEIPGEAKVRYYSEGLLRYLK